jgi:hypothetical protein
LQTVEFPRFLHIRRSHNGVGFCNIPRCIKQNVEWISECLEYLREHEYQKIESTLEAEQASTDHVVTTVQATRLPTARS